jgi:hypothetical protein
MVYGGGLVATTVLVYTLMGWRKPRQVRSA